MLEETLEEVVRYR